MFKSKGFTIGFAALAVLIIGLAGVLIYLLPKNQHSTDFSGGQIAGQDSTPVSVPNQTDFEGADAIRALNDSENHIYPIIGEEIAEAGVLKVVESAENSGGIVFHKKPEFDAADSEGNVINYRGSFDIVKKIFIMDNEKPYIMYETADGYFVTSNKNYVAYTPSVRTIAASPEKITTYGYDSDSGLILTVYAEDGNHLAFSLFSYDGLNTGEVLPNIIAKYDAFGIAHFEYHYNGAVHDGTLGFTKTDGKISGLLLKFDSPVSFGEKEITELALNQSK